MAMPMSGNILAYDVYPRVFITGKEQKITILPSGKPGMFTPEKTYNVEIVGIEGGRPGMYECDSAEKTETKADSRGAITITHTFMEEQEYALRIILTEQEEIKRISQFTYNDGISSREGIYKIAFSVYALGEDMAGRYPFMGDLHMHSCCSDGNDDPRFVAANYRAYGYDFTVISDHKRYYPSIDTINFYKPLHLDFNIVQGEEVHLPDNDVHIINFGGDYSVNGLWQDSEQCKEMGTDKSKRSIAGECPETISTQEYRRQVAEIAEGLTDIDGEKLRTSYASCLWIWNHIRAGHGLGIFCHPMWRYPEQQIPTKYLDIILKKRDFDAFEVLGGERYYEHNGFQTAIYYEQLAKGNKLPIVGSTDSHGSTFLNASAFICETLVFAKENTRDGIVSAIKDYYSVAVDTIDNFTKDGSTGLPASQNFHLVGELRLQRYAAFLLKYYFPIHDKACAIQGEYMRQFAMGEEIAALRLQQTNGDVTSVMKKYIRL